MTLTVPVLTLRARTAVVVVLLAMLSALAPAAAATGALTRLIVQALPGHVGGAADAVESVGGTVGAPLPLVDGFVAEVPAAAVAAVANDPAVRAVSTDDPVHFEELSYDDTSTASNYAKTSGASAGWAQGRLGQGVGVAVIDTGISEMPDLTGRIVHGPDLSGEGTLVDSYGHGTVMGGIIGGSGADSATNVGGKFSGVAPKSTLVAVKAAGRNGAADVSTMLQAMHWVASYKDQFNIRVLNLSWGTASKQDPSIDPLNYAVQRLWSMGIVVVTAAGNSGPQSGTITKPGDDPVALTVGAFDDKQNIDPIDDSIPAWSSRGPTAQGLTKPDVMAPGRTLIAQRSYGSKVEADNPKALIAPSYIKGSGSSQAAAVVSGLAAQLLGARPELTPDQVKAILKGTASPIAGQTANYQGTGRVSLAAALTAPTPTATQALTSSGLGSIEASRGGMNVQSDCNGDGVAEVIQGEIDVKCEVWNGSAWTGSAWTGSAWTGSAWTGSAWTGSAWTGSAWTGSAWTGSAWTTAEYGDDLFLTVFWGPKPKPGKYVPGEEFTPLPPGQGQGLQNHFGASS